VRKELRNKIYAHMQTFVHNLWLSSLKDAADVNILRCEKMMFNKLKIIYSRYT
jgi:hypothetical protein